MYGTPSLLVRLFLQLLIYVSESADIQHCVSKCSAFYIPHFGAPCYPQLMFPTHHAFVGMGGGLGG